MASVTLYPPIISSTSSAFVAGGSCRIYYSLSKFSASASNIKSIHLSIIRQSTGITAVNKTDADNRYRSSGIIILNQTPQQVDGEDNLYYVDILNDDIAGGWSAGYIYKIQIRVSSTAYDSSIGQASWLTTNAGYFSEWSTYCVTKAIYKPVIKIVPFNYDSSEMVSALSKKTVYSVSSSTLNFTGTYNNTDTSEVLYSYRVCLFTNDDELIEDSGILYSNEYHNCNQFNYLFKKEFSNNTRFYINLTYTTLNKYEQTLTFPISINFNILLENYINITTADKKPALFTKEVFEEEEEGRIGLKLLSDKYVDEDNLFMGNIYIRRSSSKDNFSTWEDIKLITCEAPGYIINDMAPIYDYTIESGVWYRYGVQIAEKEDGIRSVANLNESPVLREFEFSFLLGENNQQLKLPFDNTMNSYAYTKMDGKTDTINGEFPTITRVAGARYRTFPVNGLISFRMDEEELFLTEKELYKYEDVIDLYSEYKINKQIDWYDYIKERDFREKVLAFLYDGKAKLFKSPTEGNIVVRLMNVAPAPNQSLNRMLSSFSSNAVEIADATVENYKKYNFIVFDEFLTTYVTYKPMIGQLDFSENGLAIGSDIIEEIYKKYDFKSQSMAGSKLGVEEIGDISIEFMDNPINIDGYTSGYLLEMNGNNLYSLTNIYTFDKDIRFKKTSTLKVLAGKDNISSMRMIVNFSYKQSIEPWVDKEILTQTSVINLGQYCELCDPDTNIYNEISNKYTYDWSNKFRHLNYLIWGKMEALPGTIIGVKDVSDEAYEEHVVNGTGALDLSDAGALLDLRYLGYYDSTGARITNEKREICINYLYYTTEGTYKEEA